jgi:hypothetical protein
MSVRAYKAALRKLGLTVAGQKTARCFGVGVRHCMRIAHGKVRVPRPVELLIGMYLKHGLPDEERQ